MGNVVVPFASMAIRLPTAGRLRTGIQVPTGNRGKTRPSTIETWRATSHDGDAIHQLADIYGGTPRPWTDAPTPGQWEVITDATELNIVLPQNPLGEPDWQTPVYELWSGGGCQRRCDGAMCKTPVTGPEGPEMTEVPCICNARGELACSPHTRLTVILPDVSFGGVWRYESAKSWNVAREMPGMVSLIQTFQDRGLTRAVLALETRKSAQTKKPFTIPVLRVPASLDAIVAGDTRVAAIRSAAAPALEPGPSTTSGASLDDEVCDGEIIDPGDDSPVEPEGPIEVPADEDLVAWQQLGWKLPQTLGDAGAAAFKAWREEQGLPRVPRTVTELDALVGEARTRYRDTHGGPRPWDPGDLAAVRAAVSALEAEDPRAWDEFRGFTFENFADPSRPELWTQEQYDLFETWIRVGTPT